MRNLTADNIVAATEIRRSLREWDDADLGLEMLREHFPSNTRRSDVLVKASAVDKMYSTRAGNIYWVANAVVATMEDVGRPRGDGERLLASDVVDMVSQNKLQQHPGSRRCASFASKYCHFFVEGWDFPIFDSFALAAVRDLTGRLTGLTRDRSEYRDFCERICRLRKRDHLDGVGVRDLDRFLWLWGQWIFQAKHTDPVINADVYEVFRTDDAGTRKLIEALQPRED